MFGDASIPHISDEHMKLQFDLSKPIAGQLNAAKRYLEKTQKRIMGQKIITRSRPDKYLEYLRVLDAKESGASLSEIAKIILSDRSSADPQKARDVLKQAKSLMGVWI